MSRPSGVQSLADSDFAPAAQAVAGQEPLVPGGEDELDRVDLPADIAVPGAGRLDASVGHYVAEKDRALIWRLDHDVGIAVRLARVMDAERGAADLDGLSPAESDRRWNELSALCRPPVSLLNSSIQSSPSAIAIRSIMRRCA